MADFRRSISVLALVALMLGSAVTASAQNAAFQCVANAAVPTLVRSEGLTELVGDLVLNCTGGNPTPAGQPVPAVNIQIFLNTAVTSDLLSGVWSEALLMLDEPGPSNQFPCQTASGVCTARGNGTGAGIYSAQTVSEAGVVSGNVNVFQGQQAGSNSLLWLGIPIDAPGSNTRVIRITNVRANANALGVAGGNSAPTPIIMTVSATGATSVPINNPQQTVAFVLKGLQFSVFNVANTSVLTAPIVGLQCVSLPAPGRIATLRFTELFATAFKKRTVASTLTNPAAIADQNGPGVIYNTESGFVNRAWAGNSSTRGALGDAGLAEFGTRLKATFTNVPAGVSLYVDQCASEFGSPAARVCGGRALSASGVATPDAARATTSETGGFSALAATTVTGIPAGVVPVTIAADRTGTVVWEVSESDAQTLTTFSFQLYGTFTANPGATGGGSPAIGTASINGSFAPVSTVGIAASTPIPRFADTSTSTNVFSIVICQTNLLFPFVTNQAGFDTGLAIAATATDPFGTAPQGGTCTLNWYGANAPAATVTPTVASGTVYTTLASTAAPNFQGYMIAVCRFQYGHGFAFVSDLGATRLAMGYLALVIPDPARSATVPTSGSPSGEQLLQ